MKFTANGKLLISSEYAVLCDAWAFAIPTKFHQTLNIKEQTSDKETIKWKIHFAYTQENQEFTLSYDSNTGWQIVSAIGDGECRDWGKGIVNILNQIIKFGIDKKVFLGKEFNFQIDFNHKWGLGTSSTMISLLSQYLKSNPYTLLENTFGGSGYDIACATTNKPILYNKKNRKTLEVDWTPKFSDNIFFVYTNNKQISSVEIRKTKKYRTELVKNRCFFSELSFILSDTDSLLEFKKTVVLHERKLASILEKIPIQKNSCFKDCPFVLKSLGAWGGDFIMAIGDEADKDYFEKKGFNTIFSLKEILPND